ncbi:DUF262 domain-containing protein [Oceanimonas smirnovii]|uniref:DUF262 domain-containing protein n=1 Tax=Oceanimonas smirnovii TaxID=264574 RepID=UPI003FCF1AB7
MSQSSLITLLSVKKLLNGDDAYLIPMYQRNYAWEEEEITQLIEDVFDYLHRSSPYYIGTLVVDASRGYSGKTLYEVVDGQQRLTTLTLLAIYLRNLPETRQLMETWYSNSNVSFECREHSQQTLLTLFRQTMKQGSPRLVDAEQINPAIENGYHIIQKVLRQKCNDSGASMIEFAECLLHRVQLLRVGLPENTDLNHYFEVMNNRGEQLVKHEVLKARLLSVLSDQSPESRRHMRALHLVWDACANMDRYVQSGFSSTERTRLFGDDWNRLQIISFDKLSSRLDLPEPAEVKGHTHALSIDELIGQVADKEKDRADNDAAVRFRSVINFPDFLLQVLRVTLATNIPLDDKQLLEVFDDYLLQKEGDVRSRVKDFVFALLRCKYLFDHFVIKRDLRGEGEWSLLCYNKERDYSNTFSDAKQQAHIRMILAAFHVSAPTSAYKHWLNASLHWLYHQSLPVKAEDYLTQLESVARSFVFDRYLATEARDYFELVYVHQGRCLSQYEELNEQLMLERLSYGNLPNSLVFNYLDYLLWKKYMWEKGEKTDPRIEGFEFTIRSSIEHYYPQHPRDHEYWEHEYLHGFGNLCLISHSKNARLSDHLPEAKKEHYLKGKIDSIKQYLMMQGGWSKSQCKQHQAEMLQVLKEALADSNRRLE